uniref:Uncharacterized protein n=1 Tax=Arundo donax TaxID=35708 RepID=A0A0A8YW76_ARUDO
MCTHPACNPRHLSSSPRWPAPPPASRYSRTRRRAPCTHPPSA